MSFLTLPKNHWGTHILPYLNKAHMVKLNHEVESAYQKHTVLPEQANIFKALKLTDYNHVKVVIIGQDPYPNPDNAMGLAFSVKPNVKVPMSLQNIYLERYHDLGIPISESGDLTNWAKQGVLLLNSALTITLDDSQPAPETTEIKDLWSEFTDSIIKALINTNRPLVFILWGNYAISKANLIPKKDNILILTSSHPSPFSARISFFGSYPFSKTNHFLTEHQATPINWEN